MKKILYSVFALVMAAFTLASCEDVPAPYDDPNDNPIETPDEGIEATGDGTLENPFNVAGAIKYVESLGDDVESDKEVYIKGIVTVITNNFDETGTFGNAEFYISDDAEMSNQFYCFRTLYLGNKKYTSGDVLERGDEVVVCGKVVNYRGNTPETVASKSYVYSLNGQTAGGGSTTTGEPKGDGTLENPFNSVAANQYASSLSPDEISEKDVYIKGIVVSITENYTAQFGNATFYISDDGTSEGQFLVYRALYLDNKKYTSGDLLSPGDEVVICGKVTNYKGNTLETQQNQSYLYSWTKGSGSVGGDEEKPGTSGEGLATTTKSGNIVTMVDPDAAATGSTVTYDLNQFTDPAGSVPATTVTLSDGTVLTFSKEGGMNEPIFHSGTRGVRMYALNSMTVTTGKKIAKMVLTCDVYNGENLVGNDQLYAEIGENSWKVVNDYTQNSGGTQLRIRTIEITFAE